RRTGRGRDTGRPAGDAAKILLRPHPPDRVGEARRSRHHRGRRSPRARRRRLSRLRRARGHHFRQRDGRAPRIPRPIGQGLTMTPFRIERLASSAATRAALSDILVEVVAHGGSVSFMHPLPPQTASRFWEDSLAAADRGERIVLGAFDGDTLIGTVTLLL